MKLGVLVHTYNPSTWQAEDLKFKARLRYIGRLKKQKARGK
jgi:hypothetical protein